MTLGEFKAFLEGMGVEGAPTEDQWARIVERLGGVKPDVEKTVMSPYTVPNGLPLDDYRLPKIWYGDLTARSSAAAFS